MDSMRSLNTSLPSSRSGRPAPPEQLLQAFKTAALSVTNLYKSSVTDQAASRQMGYQDALEDLLAFLDTENLGLQDGEGWRVRQWATEKYDRESTNDTIHESDEEQAETEKERSTSPARSHNSTEEESQATVIPQRSTRSATEPPSHQVEYQTPEPQPTPMYRFTGAPPAPQDTPMDALDNNPSTQPIETGDLTQSSSDTSIRVEVLSRGPRTPHRHASSRHNTRTSTRDFTFTTGTKRKLQFPDFFDISNIGPRRDSTDGNGGGKRGRFV